MWTAKTVSNGLFHSLWQATGLDSYGTVSPSATGPLRTSGEPFSLARIADRFPSSLLAVPAIAFFSASLPACAGSIHATNKTASARASEPKKTYVIFGKTGFIAFPAGTKAEAWSDPKSGAGKKVTLGGIHVQNGIVFGPGDQLFFKDQNIPELLRAIPKSKTTVKGSVFAANQAMEFVNGQLSLPADALARIPGGRLGAFQIKPSSQPLTANDDSTLHYVTERSEKDGLLDLQKAAEASAKTVNDELEDAWIFVQCRDTETGRPYSFWFEIGAKETPTQVTTAPESTLEMLQALVVLNDQLNLSLAVEKTVNVHYHPTPFEKPGSVNWGVLYPSPTDLGAGVVSNQSFYEHFGNFFGGTHEQATVARNGVWRQKWIGATADPSANSTQKRTLDIQAAKAWDHLQGLIRNIPNPPLVQTGTFQKFAEIYSNPLTTLTFEALP